MNKDDEMSNTFVAEVGQKSAIFNPENNEPIESLEETTFPEVKIDPPKDMPSVLENDKPDLTEKEQELEKSDNNNDEEDDEFLESKKKKKNKKRNPFITFLIIIVCLALGAFGSYYYFEIFNKTSDDKTSTEQKNTNNSVVQKEDTEEILPTSTYIEKLIEKYDTTETQYKPVIYQNLYSKDKIMASDLDNEYVQKLGVANIRNSFYFTEDELNNSLAELFGKDKFKAVEKEIEFTNDCSTYKYNNKSYTLEVNTGCGGTSTLTMKRKIVKAEKKDNNLYVNVAVALTDGNKIYKGYDGEKATDELADYTYQTFDIEKDYAKLNQYKYTFDYDKDNNNYYLESIELVK
ncbi:MAG: hypothetical protein Q4E39_02435 [bacterium]|nr:hypothetical protein [bacterium]